MTSLLLPRAVLAAATVAAVVVVVHFSPQTSSPTAALGWGRNGWGRDAFGTPVYERNPYGFTEPAGQERMATAMDDMHGPQLQYQRPGMLRAAQLCDTI
jgi:hypothetical protein